MFDAVTDDQILAAQRELACARRRLRRARVGGRDRRAAAAGRGGGVLRRLDRRGHRHRPRAQGHRHRARGCRPAGRPRRRRRRDRRGRRPPDWSEACLVTLRRRPGAGRRCPRPRPTWVRASTRSGSPWSCATSSRREVRPEGLVVEVTGRGRRRGAPRRVPPGRPRRCARRSRRSGVRRPGLRLACHNAIPHARGLGSSVGRDRRRARPGACPRRGRHRARSTTTALFRLAAELEGHPDNVAPAAYGGFVISGREAGPLVRRPGAGRPRGSWRPRSCRRTRCRPRSPAACCPRRSRTPTRPPTPGAPRSWSPRSPGAPEHLLTATRDYLHQEYRRPAMPESLALVDRLRADGLAAVVSGAGPTVLVLADSTVRLRRRPRRVVSRRLGAPRPAGRGRGSRGSASPR